MGGNDLAQTLGALAPDLGIDLDGKNPEEIVLLAQRRPHSQPDSALWVTDNLPNLEQVHPLASAAGPEASGTPLRSVRWQPVRSPG